MNYFNTRYAAKQAFPNGIVRKILNHHVNANAGDYVVFNDYSTYADWKRCGHVK
jgi:L-fucose isomerase-like protein